MIGKQKIGIPNKAIDKIIQWNEVPKRDDDRFDRKICHSLLFSLVIKNDLAKFKVSDEVMTFIKGMSF